MCHPEFNHDEGNALAGFEETTDQEIEGALETAEACFQLWYRKSPRERVAVISKAAEILRLGEDAFAASAMLGVGTSPDQALREVALTADVLAYYAQNSGSLPQKDPAGLTPMHLGVIFGNQPNVFPWFQLARMTVPNFVVGNVVVVNHSGSVHPCALAFETLWQEAGAPAGMFTNVLVSPAQAKRLSDDPRLRSASSGGADAIQRIRRTTGGECQARPGKSAMVCGGSPG